jgi:hypothetical protein
MLRARDYHVQSPHLVQRPWLVENGRGARVQETAVNTAVVSENDVTRVRRKLARVAVTPDPVARVHAIRDIVPTCVTNKSGVGGNVKKFKKTMVCIIKPRNTAARPEGAARITLLAK